jgi:hypothetical protein
VTDTCTARQTDAVGAALDCELPAGHEGVHEAHTTPDVTVTWTGAAGAVRDDRVLWERAYGEEIAALKQRAADAEADRDAAVEDARRAMRQRQEMAEERHAWQERGDRAEKRADLADRVKRTAAKDAADALARADQAEATIARVRDECAAIEQERYGQHDEEDDGMREAVRRLRAALDGTGDAEPEDPCAHGCRDAADAHTRLSQDLDADAEPPTEPEGPVLHGPVPPQFAIRIDLSDTAIADAIRRAVQRASRYVQRHPGSPS